MEAVKFRIVSLLILTTGLTVLPCKAESEWGQFLSDPWVLRLKRAMAFNFRRRQ